MDRYIDNQETQTYGPQFSANLRRIFGAHDRGPLREFMLWCADQLDASTATIGAALQASRAQTSERGAAAEEKLPVVASARGDLRAFTLHLQAKKADSEDAWDGDLELFVPGGLSSVGRGARAVRDALQVARDALAADKTAPDRARWLKRLDGHIATLTPLIDRAETAGHARNAALSEQSDVKRDWLRTYRGVALVFEGVLMLLRRDGELTANVPHLTAPGGRKKTDGNPNVPTPPAPARPSEPARPA